MSIKWTIPLLKEQALKYKTRTEFARNSASAYQSAYSRGLLDTVCEHMPKRISMAGENNPNYKWSNEDLFREALKFSTRGEFFIKSCGAYQSAKERGILDQVCKHMKEKWAGGPGSSNYRHTDEKIISTAKQFRSPAEFKKAHAQLYQAARKRGLLHDILKGMELLCRRPYSEEEIRAVALKYTSRADFRMERSGAYGAAAKKGILDQICKHMKARHDISMCELALFDIVKLSFPAIKKLYDYKVKVADRPWIKRFSIDIYDPVSNRGIEFDGKHWHSIDGLRRGRPNWPEEDLYKYHEIKDGYFLNVRGIKILRINERDWISNKDECIKKCLSFLADQS